MYMHMKYMQMDMHRRQAAPSRAHAYAHAHVHAHVHAHAQAAVGAFERFSRDAPLALQRVATPSVLGVPVYPLVECFCMAAGCRPGAAGCLTGYQQAMHELEAAGAGVDLSPLKAAIRAVDGKTVDTSALSVPIDELRAQLKAASLTLEHIPWPEELVA